jgi:tetratricopeptide (TPR) repeat protein
MQFNAASLAQSPMEWMKCSGLEGPIVDTAIDGCTAVIQSGQEAPEKLATAFDNRGVAYRLRGEYDRALHDYEQAIKLNPSNANAYNNRGIIYRIKGEYSRAIADYDEAIWLKKGDFPAAYYNRALAYADKGEYGLLPRFGPMEVRSVARQDNHAAGRVGLHLGAVKLVSKADIEDARHHRVDPILRVF